MNNLKLLTLPLLLLCLQSVSQDEVGLKFSEAKHDIYVVNKDKTPVRKKLGLEKDSNQDHGPIFYLNQGEIVRVKLIGEGRFAGKNSKWAEIEWVYPVNYNIRKTKFLTQKKSSEARGLIEYKYLNKVENKFHILNEDNPSIQSTKKYARIDRNLDVLRKGDTIYAREGHFNRSVEFKLIKNGYRFDLGAKIEDKYLSEIKINDSTFYHSLTESTLYSQETFHNVQIINSFSTYSVVFLIGLIFISIFFKNKTPYNFNDNSFRVGRYKFSIWKLPGQVLNINRIKETNISSSRGSVSRFGDTIYVTQPSLNVDNSYHTEIWLGLNDGNETLLTLPYDEKNTRVGAYLSHVQVAKENSAGKNLKDAKILWTGLIFHNTGIFYTPTLKKVRNWVMGSMDGTYSFLQFMLFGGILSGLGLLTYLILQEFNSSITAMESLGYSKYSLMQLPILNQIELKSLYVTLLYTWGGFSVILLLNGFLKKNSRKKKIAKQLEKDLSSYLENS